MNRITWWAAAIAAGALLVLVGLRAHAQPRDAVKEIERYREALAEGNPAELWEARGEGLWKTKRGPRQDSQRYVSVKVYNAQAFVACSTMPRFGHKGILTEAQIAHLVALLLDPASPVNR
jgi:hypothetical protein